MSSPDAVEAAKARLMRLLGAREHSRAELARKLAQRGVPEAVVEMALDWAERAGHLNEQRFVDAYTEELRRKGYGPRAIQKKLFEKGIRDAGATPGSSESVVEGARQLVQKRHGEPDSLEPAAKLKAARFLLNRGYDHATIREVLGPIPRG